MAKVLISDKLSPLAVQVFRDRGLEAVLEPGLSPEQLAERIGAFDGLAVRSASKVTGEVLAAAERLKVVGRAGIGVDNIDVAAATQRGIVVMNTPDGNSITTAEHAIGLLFALARQIPAADQSTRAGKWQKSRFMGVELTGKVLGIVGCGNIGSIVANRALGLKMKVLAYDPYLSPDRAADLNIDKVELDELLARSDFITLHVPLTDQTRDMIDASALAKTKPGVRIVNCARGGLVVEDDLKTAIEAGQVAGAALDVFAVEPARDNPLFALEQVIATPHLGAATTEAQEKVAVQVAEQMSDYLLTGAVTNALNMPSLSAEEAKRLGPYMRLAEQLGSFAGQLTRTGLKSITIEYEGDVAELNCRPLTQAALTGILRPMLDSVNMVNSPVIARERNIDVSEVKHERGCDYQTLIRITVTTERRQRAVAGTLTNEDKPGFIGALGTTLGDAGLNIATFHLGRAAPGEDAIALIELDGAIPAPVLQQVRRLPHIKQAIPLEF
jgi:D-3-phosphoglycerate dehydrogenase